jgi:hypothetical protein
VKKRDAKPVIEAALDVLGEALADSRELILPPLGRFVVRKQRQTPNGRVITLKLRQSSGQDREARVISSVVERFVHIEDVRSSNLLSPTILPLS